ncbi:MAG: 23S rRNA (pseudouridine(1915)-N(3))-methyltransferase RlmH [Clostridiales Family XIII bacterium]|jgi:23S rRNA (pseudouridine1915-N3)-methyltransferase|nr:23S rRNA (pseudouridine(1915)-N(3))-methyltransferase RlmH [Clostridiales Family XIII bacterium]
MNIKIICVGTLKERYWREAEAEYLKRLSRFAKVEVVEIREARSSAKQGAAEEAAARRAEGEAIMRAVMKPGGKQGYVITLDINGRDLSSEALADKISSTGLGGRSDIAFIIGGSTGLSGEVLDASDMRLSFGQKTYPHQMMRIILEEQIYRSFKINAGETYHK